MVPSDDPQKVSGICLETVLKTLVIVPVNSPQKVVRIMSIQSLKITDRLCVHYLFTVLFWRSSCICSKTSITEHPSKMTNLLYWTHSGHPERILLVLASPKWSPRDSERERFFRSLPYKSTSIIWTATYGFIYLSDNISHLIGSSSNLWEREINGCIRPQTRYAPVPVNWVPNRLRTQTVWYPVHQSWLELVHTYPKQTEEKTN
jgi:hypothetical protein